MTTDTGRAGKEAPARPTYSPWGRWTPGHWHRFTRHEQHSPHLPCLTYCQRWMREPDEISAHEPLSNAEPCGTCVRLSALAVDSH